MTQAKKDSSHGRTMVDDAAEAAVRALVWAVWNFVKGAPPWPWPQPHRRSLRRSAAHLAGAAVVGWLTWLRATDPAGAAALQPRITAGAHVLGAVALGALGWSWATRWLERAHRREYVRPAWDVVCEHFEYPANWDARAYMHLTPALAADPLGVRVHAPKWFRDPKKRAAFVRDFKETLGIGSAVAHWGFEKQYSFVQFTEPARMPESAPFSDPRVRQLVEDSPEHKPMLGLGRRKAVRIDLNSEAPHVLVSMSTGGGKSKLFQALIAHFMSHGAWIVVLDVKRHSQKWLRGLAGVDYWRDMEQIHSALIRIAAEGDRRNRIADDWEGAGEPPFTRIVIGMEELNETIVNLQLWWDDVRETGDPKKSPAVRALSRILFMGRAVRINVLACGQLATAHALGGPAIRECFAARILGRCSKKAWAMLADMVENPPKVFRLEAGRFHLVVGPNCDQVQGVLYTDDEAKGFALSGVRPDRDDVFGKVPVSRRPATPVGEALAGDTPARRPNLAAVPDPVEDDVDVARAVTMAAAARERVVPMTAAAIRQAKKRDPEFPAPDVVTADDEKRWYPETLMRWYANRPREAKRADSAPVALAEPEPGDDKAIDAIFGPLPPADENGNGIPDDLEPDDEEVGEDDEVMV